MEQLKQIKEDISMSNSFKMLTQAYQEHAVEQMTLSRDSVLSARQFAQSLEEIFHDVKTSYKQFLASENNKMKKGNTHAAQPKPKKQLLVLMTASNKLYGDLILKICRSFVDTAREMNADIAVIGKLGKEFLEQTNFEKPFTYFALPDLNITFEMLRPLLHEFLTYETVKVFFGKFNNVVSQEPAVLDLTGTNPLEDTQKPPAQPAVHAFLFEPSLERILEFFESQIFSLLFSQTLQENSLARFGARINAMENAQRTIEVEIEQLLRQQKRIKALMANKKQLEQLAGRRLWQKK